MSSFRVQTFTSLKRLAAGEGGSLERKQLIGLLCLLVSLSLLLGFLISGNYTRAIPAYKVADIARADVVVPTDILIKDEEATRARRAEARKAVLPVYRFDPSASDKSISKLSGLFVQCRGYLENIVTRHVSKKRTAQLTLQKLPPDSRDRLLSALQSAGMEPVSEGLLEWLVREDFNVDLQDRLVRILRQVLAGFVVLDEKSLIRDKGRIQTLNTVSAKEGPVPLSQVTTLRQAGDKVGDLLDRDADIPPASRPLIRQMLDSLLFPNLKFDLQTTETRQAQAAENVDPVLRQLKKGKIILRQGDEVGLDQLNEIEAIRKLSPGGLSLKQTLGSGMLIALLLTMFGFFLRLLSISQWSYLRLVGLCSLAMLANILLLKISWFTCESISRNLVAPPFNERATFFYALPFASGAMLITVLAGERCAQLYLIFYCLLAGQSVGSDFYGYFYILTSSLFGIISVRNVKQRIEIVGSSFKLGLAAIGVFFIIQISKQEPLGLLNGGFGAALAFLSGPVNASLLAFALPFCERLFMVTTEIRLSELGNLNLPLIRELIFKAPGTYNHSISVGTLSEGAAKAIGLNPLFLRVAAVYHDIGKTVSPQYFVENQQAVNPHDQLSPQESVKIVKAHVTEGIRLAREASLPPSIIDLIPQHHGTKLLHFFYEKAKKLAAAEGALLREEEFRYSGPKPQTKAAAILMLADGVEAAARTLENHSQERLLDLIQKIITSTTEDGQFSDCDITLAEIDRITFSFLETLSSIYHSRVAYPGFQFDKTPIARRRLKVT